MSAPESDAERELFRSIVDSVHDGQRFDAFLADQFPAISRSNISQAIRDGLALVDGTPRKPAYRVKMGQRVSFQPPPPSSDRPIPEDIPLDILHEDAELIAINKPAGMVVHPAKGHWSGTLTAALAYHFDQLSSVGGATRPGIIHRLDRDTSGVIVIAKTDQAHLKLASQFEKRTVKKQYTAIVRHVPDRDRDVIDQPIGVHPYNREKMAIRSGHATSRPAVTRYEVAERFRGCALLEVYPQTGRTHQIRVHLAHIGCPVLCDRLYAGHGRLTLSEIQRLAHGHSRGPAGTQIESDDTVIIDRQALHAIHIEFDHPKDDQRLAIEAPLASDMSRVLAELRRSAEKP